MEVFYGPAVATDPFQPGRPITGFLTGPLGMGHAVLRAPISRSLASSAIQDCIKSAAPFWPQDD